MKKVYILIATLIWLAIFTQSCNKHMHLCHQDKWNNKPHKPGASGNFKHDLSRYY
jgi:hypothetical protein